MAASVTTGRALRYAGGSARGLLHQSLGHCQEVKRRADVVRIFPNEASITRLIGAVLFEQNDEWQTASRYMMVEAFAEIDAEETDPILSLTTHAA